MYLKYTKTDASMLGFLFRVNESWAYTKSPEAWIRMMAMNTLHAQRLSSKSLNFFSEAFFMLKGRRWWWVVCWARLWSESLLGSCAWFLLWIDTEHCQRGICSHCPWRGAKIQKNFSISSRSWAHPNCLCRLHASLHHAFGSAVAPAPETKARRDCEINWGFVSIKFYTASGHLSFGHHYLCFILSGSAREVPIHKRHTSLIRCHHKLSPWSPRYSKDMIHLLLRMKCPFEEINCTIEASVSLQRQKGFLDDM